MRKIRFIGNPLHVGTMASLLLFICSVSHAQTSPHSASSERIHLNGFSIIPPSGRGWVRKDDPNKLENVFEVKFGKMTGDSIYILHAELFDSGGIALQNTNEMIAYLKTTPRMQPNPRQKRLKFTITADMTLGNGCVRFDDDSEDTQDPARPDLVFEIDSHGYFCVHPKAQGVFAVVEYTRTTPKGTPHAGETAEGENFIKSLQFTQVSQ